MRRLLPFFFALLSAAPLPAAPTEEPVGRSVNQRFGPIDTGLQFNSGKSSAAPAQVFGTSTAQAPTFQYDDRVRVAKFDTREFSQPKTSWLSKLKFWAKEARTSSDHAMPGIDRVPETKAVPVKDALDHGKTAAVRDLPGGDRTYLGPERAKLDRAVDPNKPLSGWTGDKMEPLSLGQVRELLNKNK